MKRRRQILYFSIAILVILAIIVALCNISVDRNAEGRTFSDINDVPTMQTALLLGTNPKTRDGKRPSSFYLARINATAELYKHGKFRQLIISGDRREGYDEPQTMRHDLIERGVPDSIIMMDGQGYRTLLSLRNSKQYFGIHDMIIISQKWHNERSIFLADKMNIKAVGYNADDVRHPRAIWTHIRELLARVKLFIDLYVTHREDFC
ncbi:MULTISPECIES: vancomycin high temperature exclusion protein [Prevotella]|jgi:sanA protein|uniref:SanA/YdcF family protein n=1 Tax=Prevotella TaxID=838 RepID=UPI000D1E310A|nr:MULTISPECIES: ElyC/SanA/YdcF family protein [Prevotella]PTL30315.1 protein SanA [Prevotella sp. oral taxon 313]